MALGYSTESKTQNAAHEKLVQKYSSVGGAQKKACWEGCKDLERRTVQWVPQSSTAGLQGEKSRCRNILKGPTFQSAYVFFCYRRTLCSCPHLSKD